MITPLDSYVEKDGEVLKGAYPEKLWNMNRKEPETLQRMCIGSWGS